MVLDDLRERLARTRWPEPLEGAEWDYGAKVEVIRDLCEYWRDGYDWRAQEAALNAIPQFPRRGRRRRPALLARPQRARPPLLLLHGWPGSIYEFHLIGR